MAVELATARMMRDTVGTFCPFMPSLVCVFIETREFVYLLLYSLSGIKTTIYQGIASFWPHGKPPPFTYLGLGSGGYGVVDETHCCVVHWRNDCQYSRKRGACRCRCTARRRLGCPNRTAGTPESSGGVGLSESQQCDRRVGMENSC